MFICIVTYKFFYIGLKVTENNLTILLIFKCYNGYFWVNRRPTVIYSESVFLIQCFEFISVIGQFLTPPLARNGPIGVFIAWRMQ